MRPSYQTFEKLELRIWKLLPAHQHQPNYGEVKWVVNSVSKIKYNLSVDIINKVMSQQDWAGYSSQLLFIWLYLIAMQAKLAVTLPSIYILWYASACVPPCMTLYHHGSLVASYSTPCIYFIHFFNKNIHA